VPEILLNQTPVLGGAGTVYQRKEGGPWYLYFWVKSERKRFRQSLETTDRPLAIRTAEQVVLDALARQQVGQKVLSSTLGEVIEKWEVLQRDRLARGEIRSAEYIRYLAATFRKQLGGCFGLDTPISALKQEDWDRYIPYRGGQGVAWGLAGLATGAAITGLVDAASNNSSPVIVVPNTSYELNYGSVEAVGTYGASFNYNVDGQQLMGAVNCQQGLLNGQQPGTSDQAQLLNAVCQVAYGSGS